MTDEWLEFSAQRGNDLRQKATMLGGAGSGTVFPGLSGGCKWCGCASRWLEAYEARGIYGDKVVPTVMLEATHTEALVGGVKLIESRSVGPLNRVTFQKTVSLEQLKQFAAPATDSGKDEL